VLVPAKVVLVVAPPQESIAAASVTVRKML
jgi:hypothetical protein